eukprot:TRINITY_DN42774_c0_g1_i1.p3 TRINITY_DN42774_c0_g1~~TRINITY_DN42774_c0_g1_i1.p3  ORF type:complete len:144 (-),score=22.55 TRINITY_DN42774_c0_g1_i1:192-623(-)
MNLKNFLILLFILQLLQYDNCLVCQNGYYSSFELNSTNFQYKICRTCVTKFCDTCENNGSCQKCISGFSLDKSQNLCIKCLVDYCSICEPASSDKCLKCHKGFLISKDQLTCESINVLGTYLNEDNKVQQCDISCLNCNGEGN